MQVTYQQCEIKRQVILTSDLHPWESNQDFASHGLSAKHFGTVEVLLQKMGCVQSIHVTYTGFPV